MSVRWMRSTLSVIAASVLRSRRRAGVFHGRETWKWCRQRPL
jgi:hypothetical protein